MRNRNLCNFTTMMVLTVGYLFGGAVATADEGKIKRPLEHSDYDLWHTLSGPSISNDGSWILYTINSGKVDGDSTVVIRSTKSKKQYSIVRGSGARFSFDSRFAAYRVSPDPDVVKKLKKEKADATRMPQPYLEILDLKSGQPFVAPRVKTFIMPQKNGRWLGYLINKPAESETAKAGTATIGETYEVTPAGLQLPEKKLKLKKREELEKTTREKKPESAAEEELESKPAESGQESKDSKKKKDKPAGSTLVLRDLETGIERRFPDVIRFAFSKFGNSLAFATSFEKSDNGKNSANKDQSNADASQRTDGVFVFDLEKLKLEKILEGTGNYRSLAFNEKGNQLALLSDKDDYDADSPSMSLYHWRGGQKTAKKIADESTEAFPKDWWISSNAIIRFSEDDRRLFFATAPIPEKVIKERKESAKKNDQNTADKMNEEKPKAKLDVWHWQDPLLQPQQLIQAETERRRDYRAVYDLRTKKIYQLATLELPIIVIDHRSKTDFAIATTNLPYRKSLSWDVQGFQDCYLVNLKTGERKLVLKESRANPRMSPEGDYLTWWDAEQLKWFALSTEAIDASASEDENPVEPIEISKGIEFPLQDERHDTPSLPRPYGSAGWLQDDDGFLVYDRFDIWQLDPQGKQDPVCLTAGEGRQHTIRFRYQQLDPEQRAIDPKKPLMLTAFNDTTKASGFYRLAITHGDDEPHPADAVDAEESDEHSPLRLIMLDERLTGLRKARDSDEVMFTRSTFIRCPDIWQSTTKFDKITRISDINPQQSEYSWGTAELVHWQSATGEELDGILYKPDGFDASRKYPLMVYFYERNSDNLHAYYTPAAGRSIINHSFYVSRGYLLFVPDIPYRTGEPGPSAYDSIVPGVQNLIAQGFVDEKRIGMQGHSWGGYQTAYLVTRTDLFACAESGAPVSNMTSAYGGIRWSSGMSRMFQYERTQSRIGQDLWSARDKYIANSPVFFADKINTPLLILHNDEDGAVPWYQGIELFVALATFGKTRLVVELQRQSSLGHGGREPPRLCRPDAAVLRPLPARTRPNLSGWRLAFRPSRKEKSSDWSCWNPEKTPNTTEEEPAN
jgi:dipeptidyl aminopeptidase/acylaminoacyl peptidase